MNLNRMEPSEPLQAPGYGCAATNARVPTDGRIAHSGESGVGITKIGERDENASVSRGELPKHPGAHEDFKFRAIDAYAVRQDSITTAMSERTAQFDIWDREPFGNPAHGLAKRDTEDTHYEVNVGMTSAHVADKAAHAVASLVEMQRGVSVAVSVILWSPAPCALVANVESKRTSYFKNRDMLLDPRCVGL